MKKFATMRKLLASEILLQIANVVAKIQIAITFGWSRIFSWN